MPSQIYSHAPKPDPALSYGLYTLSILQAVLHITSALHVPMQGGCQARGACGPQQLCGVWALGHVLKAHGGMVGT